MNELESLHALHTFRSQFGTDEDCRAHLEKLRWLHGFECPKCLSTTSWARRATPHLRECSNGHLTSPTAGTVLHRTRIAVRVWFEAAYRVTMPGAHVTPTGLQKALGLTRYETAASMLQKLDQAVREGEQSLLRGRVEVDEAFLPLGEPGVREAGRKQVPVLIGVETIACVGASHGRPGRVRMSPLPNDTASVLLDWVRRNVHPGAIVVTDGWKGYNGLGRLGYTHERVMTSRRKKRDGRCLPLVQTLVSHLLRYGRGGPGLDREPEQLAAHLDEFTRAFNQPRWTGFPFERALGLARLRGADDDVLEQEAEERRDREWSRASALDRYQLELDRPWESARWF